MKTVTFEVRSANEAFEDTLKQLESDQPAKSATYVFTTPELLWQTLNGQRWEILKYLCGKKPIPAHEVSMHLGRDVHLDLEALLDAGVVDRKKSGISFPYEEIKVDFLFKAA